MNQRQRNVCYWAAGAALVGLGSYLALTERPGSACLLLVVGVASMASRVLYAWTFRSNNG